MLHADLMSSEQNLLIVLVGKPRKFQWNQTNKQRKVRTLLRRVLGRFGKAEQVQKEMPAVIWKELSVASKRQFVGLASAALQQPTVPVFVRPVPQI